MKNKIMKLTAVFLLLIINLALYGMENNKKEKFKEASESWNVLFDTSVQWQKLTQYGFLLVKTENSLICLNPANGEIKWQNFKLGGIKENEYEEISGTPFVLISSIGESVGFYRLKSIIIFNSLDGNIICDTKQDGINNVFDYKILYKNGSILLIGNEGSSFNLNLYLYDIKTGAILWKSNELFSTKTDNEKINTLNKGLIATIALSGGNGIICSPYEINNEFFMVATIIGFNKINTKTGKIEFRKIYNDMGIVQSVDKIKFFKHPKKDNISIIQMINEEGSGKNYSIHMTCYNAMNTDTGEFIWQKTLKYSNAIHRLIMEDGGIIFFSQTGKTSVNLIDYNTGEMLWGKKGGGINTAGHLIDFIKTENGYALTMLDAPLDAYYMNNAELIEQEDYYINILDAKTGALKFNKDVKVKGKLKNVVLAKCGLIYATDREVNIVDVKSLKFLLSNPIESLKRGDNYMSLPIFDDQEGFYVFSSKDAFLYKINKDSGKVQKISKKKIDFKENDYPYMIEKIGKKVLLISAQTVSMIDENGNVEFSKYYPGDKGISIARKVFKVIDLSENLSNPFAIPDLISDIDRIISTRKKSGKSKNYIFMTISLGNKVFAEMMKIQISDTYGIARIDKNTGDIIDVIYLGKNDKPKFEVDPIEDRVYFNSSVNKISCYQF